MNISKKVLDLAIAAMTNSSGCLGYCLDCETEHSEVEPDAERYKCECCEASEVYGAEQIVLMGCY